PHSVENFLPLCPACNSRKGTDDLLVWWRIEHDLATLDLDALCVWARLRHRWADARGWLDRMPPEPVQAAVRDLLATLPANHQAALVAVAGGRAVLATGRP